MNTTRDIATSRPVVRDDHAQVLRLPSRVAHVALELGLGRPHPTRHGFLFSREDERQTRAEIERRRLQRQHRAKTAPKPAPRPVVVFENRTVLQGLREVEIELIELQLKVRTLTAVVLAGGS